MRVQAVTVVLLLVAFALSGCGPVAEQSEADVAAIKGLAKAWAVAAEAEDIPALLALRTDDIVQYPPGKPIARGKQALEDFYRGLFEHFSVSGTWVEETEEVELADGLAFYVSEYILKISPKAGGETAEERGKIMIVCRRQRDGSWLWAHEIWNRNSPPPATE